jgi:DNA recombination protein RmuC
MTNILLLTIIVLLLIVILIQLFRNPSTSGLNIIQAQLFGLQTAVDKLTSGLKEDFSINRNESADLAKTNRQELNETLHGFKAEQSQTLANITTQNRQALLDINQTLNEKVSALVTTIDVTNNNNREHLLMAFKTFQDNFDAHIKTFNEVQRDKFAQMETNQQTLIKNTETKLESIRVTVEEKLEKTLSERLGQSFETVGKQLIEVQKGLGEMQTIASDVGGLKKVLSNVKLRGGVGEVQLALLLEQILAPSQYDANVRTKKGSSEPVEFAIKLPGRNDDEHEYVYLPIDAKFPKDTYEHLLTAYEHANPDDIEAASKNLETTIKKMAKDIRDKYIDPPHTTDFAILFLPFESIYAEVIRRSALIDQLRTEFKITVAGPTTLMAILNSLQMGFRTLALQKRSSEVWTVLGKVKKEFENFGGLLEKAQKNIQTGLGQLDEVVGTRTRAINKQLRQVESLPVGNVGLDLPMANDDTDETIEN